MSKSLIIKQFDNINPTLNVLNKNLTDCIICFNSENPLILMINNFCNCFENVLICEKCFIKWLFLNNKCFVCRVKFISEHGNKFEIFDIQIENLYTKILIKMETIFRNIPRDNIVMDRRSITNHWIMYNRIIDKIPTICILLCGFYMFVSIYCIVNYLFILLRIE